MNNRIIEISEYGIALNEEFDQLLIKKNKETIGQIPIPDISLLLISNSSTSISTIVIAKLLENKATILFCDNKFLPAGIIFPFNTHCLQSKILKLQIDISDAKLKRLWKDIVIEKIKMQSFILKKTVNNDEHLFEMRTKVLSGDSTNVEARAAKKYWSLLFENKNFTRTKKGATDLINVCLNYGYTILRGMICRAICASGLNPSLGIHHDNQLNAFCLADDFMEPYRPLVDKIVFDIMNKNINEFGKEAKLEILNFLTGQFEFKTKEGIEKLQLSTIFLDLCRQYISFLEDQNNEIKFQYFADDFEETKNVALSDV